MSPPTQESGPEYRYPLPKLKEILISEFGKHRRVEETMLILLYAVAERLEVIASQPEHELRYFLPLDPSTVQEVKRDSDTGTDKKRPPLARGRAKGG